MKKLLIVLLFALPMFGNGAARVAALPDGTHMAVATFSAVPTAEHQAALEAKGLTVQRMKHLPLAIVRGTRAQVLSAVGVAGDVYPDDRMEYFWDVSNRTMKADSAQALGWTGKGVQVAVVDSGIDATHPDLADHVTHNVKLLGPEYANQHPDFPPGTLVVPIDQGPYNNTDLGSGHGTHVAGIIAADGTTHPSQRGVAPDAELIGYAIGEVALTTAVISAYDHILDHPEWGIDVVNNSWGSQFMLYDPAHPINVATKAVADKGSVIVFAAGNSGGGNSEMTLNPFSMPPWVISVAASTVTRQRASFSSNGLVMDNSTATAPTGGHVAFSGDRIGIYHPDVSAPGANIVSSCGPTAAYVGPCVPGGTIAASGTSMASPQIAGVAAVLLEANPGLTAQRLRETLEATARPLADGSEFWQAGYGLVNVTDAINLARKKDPHGKHLAKAKQLADARVLGDRDWQVVQSDFWTWAAPPASAAGVPDTKTVTVNVPAGTEGFKATVAYPSGGFAGSNTAEYTIAVRDADGDAIGTYAISASAGMTSLFVDLRTTPNATPGAWTVTVEGIVGASDPDTADNESVLGRTVTLQAATLMSQARVRPPMPVFTATGTLPLKFGPSGATPLLTPEGCFAEEGTPSGKLAASAGTECHSGAMGYLLNRLAEIPAVFISDPLATNTTFGGTARMRVHLSDPTQPAVSSVFVGRLIYTLEEVDPNGASWAVATGDAVGRVTDGANDVTFDIPPATVAAGNRLQLQLAYTTSPAGGPSSAARLLYGGARHGDSGVTLTFGSLQ